MVKCHIVYESDDKQYITSLHYQKLAEYLIIKSNWLHNGEEYEETMELSVSNEDLIKLKDFINSLPLCKRDE